MPRSPGIETSRISVSASGVIVARVAGLAIRDSLRALSDKYASYYDGDFRTPKCPLGGSIASVHSTRRSSILLPAGLRFTIADRPASWGSSGSGGHWGMG